LAVLCGIVILLPPKQKLSQYNYSSKKNGSNCHPHELQSLQMLEFSNSGWYYDLVW
jgi:hypothetical protein